MGYPPRVQLADVVYHVWTVATGGVWFAADAEDRRRFVRLLSSTVARFGWRCHAYCVLGTHYHLLLTTPGANIAAGMQWLNAVYARGANERRGRRGHLVAERYGSKPVESEAHALEVCRYLPLNPVRAGLCERPEQWPWSSYAATIGRAAAPPFLDPTWILDQFARDRTVAQAVLEAWTLAGLGRPSGLEYLRGG